MGNNMVADTFVIGLEYGSLICLITTRKKDFLTFYWVITMDIMRLTLLYFVSKMQLGAPAWQIGRNRLENKLKTFVDNISLFVGI